MTQRVILGQFSSQMRLRVSRPGYDVLDPNLTKRQLAFDSTTESNMRVITSGEIILAANMTEAAIYTFPNSIAPAPLVLAWVRDSADGWYLPLGAGTYGFYAWMYASYTEIRARNLRAYPLTVRYFAVTYGQ